MHIHANLNRVAVTSSLALLAMLACSACAKKPQPVTSLPAPAPPAGGSVPQPPGGLTTPSPTGAQAKGGTLEDSQSAAGVSELAIDIVNGGVECSAADVAAGVVQVDWRITEASGPGVKAKLEDLQIVLSQEGGKLLVKDNYTGTALARRPELKLWLRVHKDVVVSLQAGNGSASLATPKLAGISLGNGSVELSGELVQDGGIAIGNGSLAGKLTVAAGQHSVTLSNGRINLSLMPGSSCAVSASVSTGQVDAKGFPTQRNWHQTGGTVTGTVGAGQAKLSLDVGNGQIVLDAPTVNAATEGK